MTVVDYAAKFKELSRFFLHYNGVGAKGLSVSSLRVVYVQRSRNSSGTRRFVISMCLLISVGSMMKIVVLDLLTIRVLVRKKAETKIVENLMEFQLIKGSGRLQVGKIQVGETLLLL